MNKRDPHQPFPDISRRKRATVAVISLAVSVRQRLYSLRCYRQGLVGLRWPNWFVSNLGCISQVDGPSEIWISISRDIAARQTDSETIFNDVRIGTSYQYMKADNKLVRSPIYDGKSFEWVESIVKAILRGDEMLPKDSAGDRIVARQHQIEVDGHPQTEYALTIESYGGPNSHPLNC